jgi:hypothetical protein
VPRDGSGDLTPLASQCHQDSEIEAAMSHGDDEGMDQKTGSQQTEVGSEQLREAFNLEEILDRRWGAGLYDEDPVVCGQLR